MGNQGIYNSRKWFWLSGQTAVGTADTLEPLGVSGEDDTIAIHAIPTFSDNVNMNIGSGEAFTITVTDVSAPFVFTNTVTTATTTGGRALFTLAVDCVMGGWANALKANTTFGVAGRVTGLGSCICADLTLSAFTASANYTVFEANVVANVGVSTGQGTSFFRGNIAGTNGGGKTTLNTNMFAFDFGEGVVTTTDGMFEEVTVTAAEVFDAVLRIRVGAASYFIGLCDDKSFT